jgi:hypothetical protein
MNRSLSSDTLRQRLAGIEAQLPELETTLATATYNSLAAPEDTEQAETKNTAERRVSDAKSEIAALRAALAVAERIEAEKLAEAQAEFRAGLIKKMRRELQTLTNAATRLEIASTNLSTNYAALLAAGETIRALLPVELQSNALGFYSTMSKGGLERIAEKQLARIGAPGVTRPISLHGTPNLSEEVKNWAAAIMGVLDPPKAGEAAL